jgi:hypothetical protein
MMKTIVLFSLFTFHFIKFAAADQNFSKNLSNEQCDLQGCEGEDTNSCRQVAEDFIVSGELEKGNRLYCGLCKNKKDKLSCREFDFLKNVSNQKTFYKKECLKDNLKLCYKLAELYLAFDEEYKGQKLLKILCENKGHQPSCDRIFRERVFRRPGFDWQRGGAYATSFSQKNGEGSSHSILFLYSPAYDFERMWEVIFDAGGTLLKSETGKFLALQFAPRALYHFTHHFSGDVTLGFQNWVGEGGRFFMSGAGASYQFSKPLLSYVKSIRGGIQNIAKPNYSTWQVFLGFEFSTGDNQ